MYHKNFIILFLILLAGKLAAQDSTAKSLGEFLRSGELSGKSRIYYMQSDNARPLTDYHGLGIGAGIGYKTPVYKGFSAAMSGYFIINAWSSDFTEPDSVTQNPNRYELGLFDLTDPSNKSNLYRLEQLWIKYKKKNTQAILGQYIPDYLFINPQDGRMSPTMVRGLDFRQKSVNGDWMLAYIQGISPRSTVKWYKVEQTFGIYPSGRATDGSASDYTEKTESEGILLAEYNQKGNRNHLGIKLGSMSVLRVFQTWYADLSYQQKGWKWSLLGIYQQKLNKNLNTGYMDSDHQSFVISSRLEKKFGAWSTNLNYTRIMDSGRFLMPREWGREPLYTFLPRERNEGMADVHAVSFNVNRKINSNFRVHLGGGSYWLPDPSDALRNKYAMPSYRQLNADLDYAWSGWLEGASMKVLFVRKDALAHSFENKKFVFNKVDLNLLNVIFNYTF